MANPQKKKARKIIVKVPKKTGAFPFKDRLSLEPETMPAKAKTRQGPPLMLPAPGEGLDRRTLLKVRDVRDLLIGGLGLGAAVKRPSGPEVRTINKQLKELERLHAFAREKGIENVGKAVSSRAALSKVLGRKVSEEEFLVFKKAYALSRDNEEVFLRSLNAAKGALEKALSERTERLVTEKEKRLKTPRPRLPPVTQTKIDNIQKIKRIIIKGTGLAAIREVSTPEEEKILMSRVDTLNKAHDFLKTASNKEITDSLASREKFSEGIGKEVSEEEFRVIKKSVEIAKDKDALLRGLRATRGELERVLRAPSPEPVPVPPAPLERGELATIESFGIPAGRLYVSIASDKRIEKRFFREMRKAEKMLAKGKTPEFLQDPNIFMKKFGVKPTPEEMTALLNTARYGKVKDLEESVSRISLEKPFGEVGATRRKVEKFAMEIEKARQQLESGEIPEFLKSPEAFQEKFGVKPSEKALGEITRMIENGQTGLLLEGIRRAQQAQGRILQKDLEKIQKEKRIIKKVSGIKLSLGVERLEAFKEFNQKLLDLLEKNKEPILRGEIPPELSDARKFKKYFGLTPEEAKKISMRMEKGALIGAGIGAGAGAAFVLSQAPLITEVPLWYPLSGISGTGAAAGTILGKIGEEGVYKARQLKTKRIVKKAVTKKDYDTLVRALRANILESEKALKKLEKKKEGS